MTVYRHTCDCGEHVTLEHDHWLEACWVDRRGEITEWCPMCGRVLEDAATVWGQLEKASAR